MSLPTSPISVLSLGLCCFWGFFLGSSQFLFLQIQRWQLQLWISFSIISLSLHTAFERQPSKWKKWLKDVLVHSGFVPINRNQLQLCRLLHCEHEDRKHLDWCAAWSQMVAGLSCDEWHCKTCKQPMFRHCALIKPLCCLLARHV